MRRNLKYGAWNKKTESRHLCHVFLAGEIIVSWQTERVRVELFVESNVPNETRGYHNLASRNSKKPTFPFKVHLEIYRKTMSAEFGRHCGQSSKSGKLTFRLSATTRFGKLNQSPECGVQFSLVAGFKFQGAIGCQLSGRRSHQVSRYETRAPPNPSSRNDPSVANEFTFSCG